MTALFSALAQSCGTLPLNVHPLSNYQLTYGGRHRWASGLADLQSTAISQARVHASAASATSRSKHGPAQSTATLAHPVSRKGSFGGSILLACSLESW